MITLTLVIIWHIGSFNGLLIALTWLLVLAHGALGVSDEIAAVIVVVAVVAYVLVIVIGDRHAKPDDDELPPDDSALPPD